MSQNKADHPTGSRHNPDDCARLLRDRRVCGHVRLGHRRSVEDSQKPVNGEAFLHVATIIAGLIGGIVAVGFGQKPPPGNGAKQATKLSPMKKVKMR